MVQVWEFCRPAARSPRDTSASPIVCANFAPHLTTRHRTLYVVAMDTRSVRWSHTEAARIGHLVSTDPSVALSGHDVTQIDNARWGAPLAPKCRY